MSSKNAIFITVNRRYYKESLVFLKILQQNYPDHPEVLLLHTDLTEKEVRVLRKYPRLKILQTNFEEQSFQSKDDPVYYIRFQAWSDAFSDYDKILHLDVDLLVLKPLDALFASNEFLIFEDPCDGRENLFHDQQNPEVLRLLDEDKLTISDKQANGGVFLIPKTYRSKEHYDTLFHLLKRYEKHLRWRDQSVINLWLLKNGIPISDDSSYNFHIKSFQWGSRLKELQYLAVLHFAGFYKTGLLRKMMQIGLFLSGSSWGRACYFLFLFVFFKVYYFLVWVKKIIRIERSYIFLLFL